MQTRGSIVELPVNRDQRSGSRQQAMRDHLERLLRSAEFDASARSRAFLRFVVDQALDGHEENLNQAVIAAAVFGRKSEDFDAVLDPIVRVQAGRLRRSLERYYLLTGDTETIQIRLPKGGYVPVFETGAPGDRGGDVNVRATATRPSGWPVVLVHPVEFVSPQDAETASRMNDELTMELCRHGDVRVARRLDADASAQGQPASARFELRSGLRRDAGTYHIGTRLVDRTTGQQIWSDEYQAGPGSGVRSSVDDVARVIAGRVGAEHGVIARVLAGEFEAQRPDVTGNFNAIQGCYHFLFSHQARQLIPAVEALQQLTAREPEIPGAWACLARLYLVNHSFELTQLQTPIEQAICYACQGVALDPSSARMRSLLAAALLVKGELQAARDEIEQALRLNPGSLAYREIIGWLLALSGDWERGVALMRETMERNPYCLPHVRHGLWADHLRRGEYERAYADALEYRDTRFFWRELMITCCLGHLGRQSEARASAARLLQAKPDFTEHGRRLIGYKIKSADLHERVVAGLGKAGLALV